MNYQDLYLLIKIVECGSFSQAARRLGMSTSTLSRRIQNLESSVGSRLIRRSARHLSLTQAGSLLFQRSQALYNELENISLSVEQEVDSPSGELTITAPIGLSAQVLDNWFFCFMDAYPNIALKLNLVNKQIDLKQEGIDVAFRIGNQAVQDWVVRTLFSSTYSLVAATELLTRLPEISHPDELHQLPLLAARSLSTWQLTHQNGELFVIDVSGRLLVDEMSTLLKAIKRGMGVSLMPDYMLPENLADAGLTRLLPAWKAPEKPVQMLYSDRQYIPRKVRVFIESILQQCVHYQPNR